MSRAVRGAWIPVCAALALTSATSRVEAAVIEDHPLVKPYPGSTLTRRDNAGFSEYKVVVGLDQKGKTDDEVIKTTPASGDLTRLAYENPKDRSPLEIFTNYKEGLEKAGFEILFECKDTGCGPGWASSRWTRVTGIRYVSSQMWFLSARLKQGGREVYVCLSIIKLRHQIDILEGKPMERGLVTVTAEALKKGLAGAGRVVLEGVFFDHDKATLKAESKPALDVIGGFLKADPKLKVFIVGHTDGSGGLDYNLKLSRQRAEAVVNALVKDYGIGADRLSAHGVGPLSPARTNRTDQGKTQNRRVEMVERSD